MLTRSVWLIGCRLRRFSHPDKFVTSRLNRFRRLTRWCLVFCSPFGLFHYDTKPHFCLSGLGTVKTIYRDPRLIVHLPGLAKTAAPRRPSLPLRADSQQLN